MKDDTDIIRDWLKALDPYWAGGRSVSGGLYELAHMPEHEAVQKLTELLNIRK